MVYEREGTLKAIDGLFGRVRLGKGCTHVMIPFSNCTEKEVDESIMEENE